MHFMKGESRTSKEYYMRVLVGLVFCFIIAIMVIAKEVGLDNPFSVVILVGGIIFGLASLIKGLENCDWI